MKETSLIRTLFLAPFVCVLVRQVVNGRMTIKVDRRRSPEQRQPRNWSSLPNMGYTKGLLNGDILKNIKDYMGQGITPLKFNMEPQK